MLFFTIYSIAAIIIYCLVARKLRKEGAISSLELESDIDCKSFFEKNCRGELVYYTENGMVYYADGTKEEYWEDFSESKDNLCYRLNRTHNAIFQKDGDKYKVTI